MGSVRKTRPIRLEICKGAYTSQKTVGLCVVCLNDTSHRDAGGAPPGTLSRPWISTSIRGSSSSRGSAFRCPRGVVATTPEEARPAAEQLGGPVVVKAQVLVGGRGKAGGIKLAPTPDEAEAQGRADPRPRHPGPRRAHAVDRARVGHRPRVLLLDHVRPRRQEAAAHAHDAGRRRHRGGRGRDARQARPAAPRPADRLPAVPRAAALLRRADPGGGAQAGRRRSWRRRTARSARPTPCWSRSTR